MTKITCKNAEARPLRKHYYRPEIDGLRTLAVLAVIINHFNKDILPSGYLGVDIFFVISGFVITSSLVNRPSKNFGDFLMGFYTRRIKRLVPPLVLCVIVTSVLICLFNPNPVASLRTGIASLFGLSNLYLLKQSTDYFATSTELNVFTHTWSLGVEEQFYFLFPFLVWFTVFSSFTAKGLKNLFWVIAVLSVASLIVFVYLYQTNPTAAYFLMPTRIWELGAGCLLFLGLNRSNRFLVALKNIPPLGVTAAIVAILFLPLHFAVWATVAVILLTTVLIVCLRQDTFAYDIFTHPQVVYIGLISYSLYLWHWSVLSLSRWTIGIYWWSVPIQIALMFLLSVASYRYIETPLRHAEWAQFRWKSIAYGLSASVISAMSLMYLLFVDRGSLYTGTKSNQYQEVSIPLQKVATKTVEKRQGTLVLIGDSHAGHFAKLAKEVADELNMYSKVITNGATPFPTVNYSTPTGGLTFRKNQNNNAKVIKTLNLEMSKISPGEDDLILLSSFYQFYFDTLRGSRKYQKLTHYEADGKTISSQESFDNWLEKLEEFAKKHQNTQIVVFLSTPEMPNLYTEALCHKEWFRKTISENCSVSLQRSVTVETLARLNKIISEKASKLANVIVFDPTVSLCSANSEFCNSHDGDHRLYSDEDHLTEYSSMKVKEDFMDFLRINKIPK